jgi:hypothetical protein
MEKDFNILVGITGLKSGEWEPLLQEIRDLNINEVGLFLINFDKPEREKIYKALLDSPITSIPLVHLRHDMTKDELEFLQKKYNTKYFTCHESDFVDASVEHWSGFYKDIYLEMNADNVVSPKVKVEEVGGFCVDTGHFKAASEKAPEDFNYQIRRKNYNFSCNHISGWDNEKHAHTHKVSDLQEFDYLKTIPYFLFGKILAIELTNSIKEQLEFREYLMHLLT